MRIVERVRPKGCTVDSQAQSVFGLGLYAVVPLGLSIVDGSIQGWGLDAWHSIRESS